MFDKYRFVGSANTNLYILAASLYFCKKWQLVCRLVLEVSREVIKGVYFIYSLNNLVLYNFGFIRHQSFILELLYKVLILSQMNILAVCGLNGGHFCLVQSLTSFKTDNVFWPRFIVFCFLFHNYTPQCSRSCARGVRTREAFCMNNLGRHLPDRECQELPRVVTQSCNEFLCPSWSVTDWSEVMKPWKT